MADKKEHPIFNRNNEAGALWEKTSDSGNSFLSGSVKVGGKEYKIILSKNIWKKDGDNSPDYRIYNNIPREQQGVPTVSSPKKDTTTPITKTKTKVQSAPAVAQVAEDEDGPLL
jgi:uncharacterized protein (DUF736 family)